MNLKLDKMEEVHPDRVSTHVYILKGKDVWIEMNEDEYLNLVKEIAVRQFRDKRL